MTKMISRRVASRKATQARKIQRGHPETPARASAGAGRLFQRACEDASRERARVALAGQEIERLRSINQDLSRDLDAQKECTSLMGEHANWCWTNWVAMSEEYIRLEGEFDTLVKTSRDVYSRLETTWLEMFEFTMRFRGLQKFILEHYGSEVRDLGDQYAENFMKEVREVDLNL